MNTPHNITVGTILRRSWGYDQTNVDFYVVTRTTKTTITFAPIAKDVEYTGTSTDYATPRIVGEKPVIIGSDTLRRKVNDYGNGPSIRIASYAGAGNAYVWSGKPEPQTGFGFGH
tara:strand:+ start:279 stop:623 length:345 start_codon:yes stop_codon:yes gene_type:complete